MKKSEPIPDRVRGEMRDKGFDVESVVPIVGVRCLHLASDIAVTAKGKVGVFLRCRRCGYSGMFVPVPRRALRADETDLMVALAREAAWPELS